MRLLPAAAERPGEAILRGVTVLAVLIVLVGLAQPWWSGTPFHIFEEPGRQTFDGYDEHGWIYALAALAGAVLAMTIPRTWLAGAASAATFGLAGTILTASLDWFGFMFSDVTLHHGVYVTGGGLALGVLAGLALLLLGLSEILASDGSGASSS